MQNKQVLYFLILLISQIQLSRQQDNKCVGLAIEGEGDHGAWEAGVLETIHKYFPSGYNVFSGVSMGGFNAVFLSTYSQNNSLQAVQDLKQIWLKMQQNNIFKKPSLYNTVSNLIFRSGVYNNEPFKEYLERVLKDKKIMRPITIGVTDMTNGKLVRFDLDKNNDKMVDYIVAGSSYPGIFQARDINGIIYSDGNVMLGLDIGSVVRRCRELGYLDDDILIDVILTYETNLKDWKYNTLNTVESLLRYLQINSYLQTNDDLLHAKFDYPHIQIRNVFKPSSKLNNNFLNFNHIYMQQLINNGQKDAEKIINKTLSFQQLQQ